MTVHHGGMNDESVAHANAGAPGAETPASDREDGWRDAGPSATADRASTRNAIPIVAVIGALVAGLVVGTVGTIIVYSVRRGLRILAGSF
jgi:hypothetical protein